MARVSPAPRRFSDSNVSGSFFGSFFGSFGWSGLARFSRRPLPLLFAGLSLAIGGAAACGGSSDDSEFGGTGEGGDGGTSGTSGNQGGGDFGTPGDSSDGGGTNGGDDPSSDACKKMDIVFVVDNSGSMKEEQTNLVANFPKFASVIDQYKTKSGAPLDYRLAVTTTKPGKNQGTFVRQRGADAPKDCVPGPDRPWLERGDGAISDMFACRAQVGTNGGSPEQSLESVYLGLTTRITDGKNTDNGASFIRNDALLAFVAITDEDEGGTENEPARDMSAYPGLFDGIKDGRGRWAAAVIAGETKCSSKGLGSAAEAKRLKQFIADVGKNGVFSSICTGDLTEGLTKALETFDQACKTFPSGPN